MSHEFAEALVALQGRIGFEFADITLLETALTHASYANERNVTLHDNERLEFLGDAVVDLVVSAALMRRSASAREGDLSRLHANLVSETALAAAAAQVGLGEVLRLGRGERKSGGATKPSILADAFEALCGAMFVDRGYEAAERAMLTMLGPRIEAAVREFPDRDYKSRVQEITQGTRQLTPVYRHVEELGPQHERVFRVELLVGDVVVSEGAGRSKKLAEQDAARSYYLELVAGQE